MFTRTALLVIPMVCLAQDAALKPVITFAKNHHDFGRISGDKKVNYRFKVTNSGKAYLNITQVSPSCGCTSTVTGKWSLAPGESTEIEIGFDPKGFRGLVRKSLQVISDDPVNPAVTLTFEAEVVQDIMPSTQNLFFLDLTRSGNKKGTVRLSSGNGQPVTVTEAKAPGAPYLSATWKNEGNDAVLEVDLDCRKVPVGSMSGIDTLSVRTTSQTFGLIPLSVQWEFKPSVTASPERVTWIESAGTVLKKTVTLTQMSGKPFRVLAAKPTRDDITVQGIGKAPASTHILQVQLKASKEGTFNESIVLQLDDPDQPELKIRVSAVLR